MEVHARQASLPLLGLVAQTLNTVGLRVLFATSSLQKIPALMLCIEVKRTRAQNHVR